MSDVHNAKVKPIDTLASLVREIEKTKPTPWRCLIQPGAWILLIAGAVICGVAAWILVSIFLAPGSTVAGILLAVYLFIFKYALVIGTRSLNKSKGELICKLSSYLAIYASDISSSAAAELLDLIDECLKVEDFQPYRTQLHRLSAKGRLFAADKRASRQNADYQPKPPENG